MSRNVAKARGCPVCGARPIAVAFPYATRFNEVDFHYLQCSHCQTVFVDPVPDDETFRRMYAKATYHDRHYDDLDRPAYVESARLLVRHVRAGARVLDYGCGLGAFLKACKKENLAPFGVEFDRDAAQVAAANSACPVVSAEAFERRICDKHMPYDAIHLGDVLEHLAEPAETLARLLKLLSPHGILYVEGPLENNPSAVLWAAKTYGSAKRILTRSHMGRNPPTHLWRTDASSQRAFFGRVSPELRMIFWQLYETGWPYSHGGMLKRLIARSALGLANIVPQLGNRFRAILARQ
jgi:2-polyprenyl-3-methyl-5-hydroxy-6-metoxy-1,4-benzoquinol methylase